MPEYSDCKDKDNELITQIRCGDEQAVEVLLEKYRPLVRRRANALFLIGGDSEDLNQEGMIGLYQAVRSYDPGRGTSFFTFADLCIRRQMYHAVEADGRRCNAPLNDALPLEETDSGDPDLTDPESQYIRSEERRDFEEKCAQLLSPYERKVLHLYLDGCRYTEIAGILHKTPKSADNAIQRIRAKLTAEIKRRQDLGEVFCGRADH